MTNQTELAEMREEIRGQISKGRHPCGCCSSEPLRGGDKEAAELILEEGSDRLSPHQKIDAHYAMKRAFGETPEAWRESQDQAHTERHSALGESLSIRNAQRRAQAAKIAAHSKPYAGERVPRREGVEYAEPNPGGFNLPVGMDRPERRGFNRIRQAYNPPEDS